MGAESNVTIAACTRIVADAAERGEIHQIRAVGCSLPCQQINVRVPEDTNFHAMNRHPDLVDLDAVTCVAGSTGVQRGDINFDDRRFARAIRNVGVLGDEQPLTVKDGL